MNYLDISYSSLAKLFWETLLTNQAEQLIDQNEFKRELNHLDTLRVDADYNTGSISLASAYCLRAITNYFQPKTVAEVGTFIGKSTISMAIEMERYTIDGKIFTCDGSNDIRLPWAGNTTINQFPKQLSGAMFSSIEENIDLFFIDGRLDKSDLEKMKKLSHSGSIIVLDDFEGTEKGVSNAFTLKNFEPFKNMILLAPATQYQLNAFGLQGISRIAALIYPSSIRLLPQ